MNECDLILLQYIFYIRKPRAGMWRPTDLETVYPERGWGAGHLTTMDDQGRGPNDTQHSSISRQLC